MTDDTPRASELPDDWQQWPSDPFVLFGLGQDASPRDLKRVYSRLIRRFKPEHAPQQFRRLREAFELLDQLLRLRELAQEPDEQDESDTEPASNRVIPRSAAGHPPVVAKEDDRTNAHNHLPEEDDLWRRALNGQDLQPIYEQLVQCVHERPKSSLSLIRLYWLLTICPDLDRSRDAAEWLAEGIRKYGFQGRTLSIITMEIRQRRGHVAPLLAEDLLRDGQVAPRDFVLARWYVARRLNRFDVIRSDIVRLRQSLQEGPESWLQILCGAIRQLVLTRNADAAALLDDLQQEMAEIPATSEASWLWDWYDATIALHRVWRDGAEQVLITDLNLIQFTGLDHRPATMENRRADQTRATISRLGALIEETWECPSGQARRRVMSFCSDLVKDVAAGFHEISAIMQAQKPLVRRLLHLIDEQLDDYVDEGDYALGQVIEVELREFVRGRLWRDPYWLMTALDFCIQEAVTPQQIADAIESNPAESSQSHFYIAYLLRQNLALTCIVQAKRLFC